MALYFSSLVVRIPADPQSSPRAKDGNAHRCFGCSEDLLTAKYVFSAKVAEPIGQSSFSATLSDAPTECVVDPDLATTGAIAGGRRDDCDAGIRAF
jgi:hypothetical protein